MQQFLVLFLVFLTGLAGLLYQVVWQKYVSLFLGSDSLATAATLTCFFTSMAFGYLAIGRLIRKTSLNRISIYCYLELAIGIYGVLSPTLFQALIAIFPVSHSNFSQNFLFSVCFMGIPTFLMGGTIPALTDGLSRSFEMSHRIHSWVYGSNTIGAFVGTLIGGFFLIETLGLPITLYVTALLNFIVFAVGRSLAKSYQPALNFQQKRTDLDSPSKEASVWSFWTLFLISFLSGFYTFSFENLLIRITGFTLGSSNYSYALIVSAFIASLAIGSYVASQFSNAKSPSTLLKSQIIATGIMILVFLSIPSWPSWAYGVKAMFSPSLASFSLYHVVSFFFFFGILVIPVAILGMNLPLVFDSAKQRSVALGETVGRIYFINCLGCAAGAALGGNIFFRFWNMSQVFKATIGILTLTIPLCALLVDEKKIRRLGFAVFMILAGLVTALPLWNNEKFIPARLLMPRPLKDAPSALTFLDNFMKTNKAKIIFSASDPLTEVNIEEHGQNRNLWIGSSNNASTEVDSTTRALAVLTPISLAPQLKNTFVVGLGAGLSTSILSGVPEVQTVEVAELSESAIKALPYFEAQNVHLNANRHKVTIRAGDAYQILRSSSSTYDLIAAEPTHIWVPGVEKLYTYEFLKAASAKLNKGGIHAQWFPLTPMSEQTFLQILKTFQSVYPYVTLWHAPDSGTLTIISSNEPIRVQADKLADRFKDLSAQLKSAQIPSPQALSLLQAAPEGLVRAIADSQDDFYESEYPRLSYESDRSRYAGIAFDLNAYIEKRFFQLNVSRNDGLLFARERSNVQLTQADYESFVGPSRKFSLLDFCQNKISWNAFQSFPEHFKSLVNPETAKFYKYLVGEPVTPPEIKSDTDFQKLSRQYHKSILMLLNVPNERFLRLFPPACATRECTTAKVAALLDLKLASAEQLSFTNSQTPEQSRTKVDELFQSAAKTPSP